MGRGDVPAHADARRVGRLSLARRAARAALRRAGRRHRADTRALWRDGDGISVEARRVEDVRRRRAPDRRHGQERADRRGARGAACASTSIRERPATRWVARLDDAGELVVSIDLGGGSLSQRGWRRDAGEAPLREHLAAVLLMLCRFDPRNDVARRSDVRLGHDPDRGGARRARDAARDAGARRARARAAHAKPLFADAAPLVDRLRSRSRRARRRARQRPRRRGRRRDHVAARRRRDARSPEHDRRRSRASAAATPPTTGCPAREPAVRRAPRRGRSRRCSTPRSPRRAAGSAAGVPASSSATRCSRRSFVPRSRPAADQEAAREREPARVLLPLRAVACGPYDSSVASAAPTPRSARSRR